MQVLVDGDRGYIGAVLVPFLRAAGNEVVGFDVGWYDGCDFGAQPTGYEQRTGDIRDIGPEDVEGFDAVIHLAAISNDPIGHQSGCHARCKRARRGSHGEDGQGGRGSSLSLHRHARCMARLAKSRSTRLPDSTPVTPYGASKRNG